MFKPIKTKKEYHVALTRMYQPMQKNLKAGSKLSDEPGVLSILVEAYEKKNYPIPPSRPIEAIKFRLEQIGIEEKEIVRILGGRS